MRLPFTFILNLLVVLALPLTHACAQDYEREKRYADEVVSGLVVGDAVFIKASSGRDFLALYTKGRNAKPAVVLTHGVGVHPDFGLTGLLRAKLADLGYTTLSIQLPVASKEAQIDDYFPQVFPDAADRMAKAAEWLQTKGHAQLVLASHSMGAWMANVYLDQTHTKTPYRAWIVMGLTGAYSWGMRRYAMPILDVYGAQDIAPVLGAVLRRKLALQTSNGSQQIKIAGADHQYAGHENQLATAIDGFLSALP